MAIEQDEVLAFLRRYVDAYERVSEEFYEFFTKDATFFTLSSPTRIDGVEEFRRGFEPNFRGQRRSQILSPEIRIVGDTALVSFHNRIAVEGRTTNLRASAVIVKDAAGDVKIAHLHNSPLEAPKVIAGPGADPQAITLLEERIATAAATVGTPK